MPNKYGDIVREMHRGFTINEALKKHDKDGAAKPKGAIDPRDYLDGPTRVMGRVLRKAPAEQPKALRRKYEDC